MYRPFTVLELDLETEDSTTEEESGRRDFGITVVTCVPENLSNISIRDMSKGRVKTEDHCENRGN